MSYVSSAGRNGKTCRQDVLRGVDVPVVPGAAGRALPRPGGQAQRGEQMPARRAGLAGRVPAVDYDQVPPCDGRLVFDHAAEGSPAAVGDRLGERPVADHTSHVQVLDHDQANSSGVLILARNSRPSRYRNPERVYSADWRPLRDLYRG